MAKRMLPASVAGEVSLAVFAGLPTAVVASVVLAAHMPLAEEAAVAVGLAGFIPLWIAAACWGVVYGVRWVLLALLLTVMVLLLS